jgi:Domain of unknown function (DUF4129)
MRAINAASSASGSRYVNDSNTCSAMHDFSDARPPPGLRELDPGGLAPLAFGYGAIACLRTALARLQATVALRRILARTPVLAAPVTDKPTGRVVALIVLLMLVAAALRGYLPGHDHSTRSELIGNRAALMIIVAILSVTLALVAMAVIARLRDPQAVAPHTRELPEMLGGGRGRTNWRMLLIGLVVIVAWLLIALLLARLSAPHDVSSSVVSTNPTASAPAIGTATPTPPPAQNPPHGSGDMFKVLLAGSVPMVLIIVAGVILMSRRRRRTATPATTSEEHVELAAAPQDSESLVRAAEVGLAEIADLSREPRKAIIACYAAMERELANVPEAVPQDFDTPTEVLARAVEHHALHIDNAVQLVNLFAEARFSPHVMNEGHREAALRVLRLVLDELAPRTGIRGDA